MILRTMNLFLSSVLVGLTLGDSCVDIAVFNIQVLGRTKMSKPDVVHSLVKILGRYDINVIQEIRDVSHKAFTQLYREVARDNHGYAANLAYITGPRLGRSRSKEQYGFIYRTDKVTLIDHVTYPDNNATNPDVFEREPEVALFEMVNCQDGNTNFTFMVIVCHVDLDAVPQEMDALVDVYTWAAHHYGTQNAIITGDFNADCGYMNKVEREASELLNDQNTPSRFISLFKDDVDTNVASGSCAYDRMILAGSEIEKALSPCHSQVHLFDEEQGLNYTEARKISDHYPIQARFCCPY